MLDEREMQADARRDSADTSSSALGEAKPEDAERRSPARPGAAGIARGASLGSRRAREAVEPLSPELVLVDAELAERARAGLPDPAIAGDVVTRARTAGPIAASSTAGAGQSGRPRVVEREPLGRYATELPAGRREPPRPSRWRRRLVSLVLAGIAVSGIALALTRPQTGRRPTPSGSDGLSPISRPRASSTTPPRGTRPLARGRAGSAATQRREPSSKTTAARRATSHRPRTREQQQAQARRQTRRPKSARPAAFLPAQGGPRRFGWVSVDGAAFYEVAFIRAGVTVFKARTTKPRLVLPRSWRYGGRVRRLTAGRYRWLVVPGFGSAARPRFGEPIVSAWLVVRG
jgi:hypothetical protein